MAKTIDEAEAELISRLLPDGLPEWRYGLRSGRVKGRRRTTSRLTHVDEGETWREMLDIPELPVVGRAVGR